MEQQQTAFEEQQKSAYETLRKKKEKQKRTRTIIIVCVLAAVVLVGGFFIYRALTNKAEDKVTGVLRYRYTTISEGEINTTITGTSTLSAEKSESVTASAGARIKAVYKQPGDSAEKDEVIMELTSSSVENSLTDLYSDLKTIQTKMTGITKTRSSLNITAPRKGIVKDIRVSEGEAIDTNRYLCLISTDGNMKVTVPSVDGIRQYETVTVAIGSEKVSGTVSDIKDQDVSVVVEDKGYSVGTSATVTRSDGTVLGTGSLTVNEAVVVTSTAGKIETVKVSENQEVNKNAVLFVLASGAYTSTYQSYYDQEQDILKSIQDMEDQLVIKASWPALVSTVSVKSGDDVTAGAALCTLTSSEGYTVNLGIDELDISQVSVGQDAVVTLDAFENDKFTGSVTNLSYDGTGSYVTSYTATITTEPIPVAYPGMSASVEITTSSSGTSMLVPVTAVQYEGPDTFVYLVPEGFDRSKTEEIDLNSFTKVPVSTGMSNGSYIVITGDGLKAGDTICMPVMETNAIFTPSDSTGSSMSGMFGGMNGMGGMGGMGGPNGGFGGSGGNRPDFGGGNRPDFGGGNFRN